MKKEINQRRVALSWPRAGLLALVIGTGIGGARAQTTPPVVVPTPAPATVETPTIGAGLIAPSPATPQPNPNLSTASALPERRGFFRPEPFYIFPWVAVGFGHNSNLSGTQSNPISSAFWVLSPQVQAEVRSGAHRHSLTYTGNYGRYTSSSADNFDDHELVFRTANQFTARADLGGSVFYLDKVDPRGTVARAISSEPDHYHAMGAQGTFGYGARSAQGRLEFDAGVTDKEYTNNRTITSGLDVSTVSLAGRFLYRIAPRTRLLAEVRATEYDYKLSTSRLDNDERIFSVGATWDLAATTSGTVRVGQMSKNFKDSGLQDYRGLNVDASVRWAPLTYSSYDILLRRGAIDSSGIGVYSVDTSMAVAWNHQWRQYISTRARLSYTHSEFQGITRTDNVTAAAIGGYYNLRSWLRVGAEYSHFKRGSTDGGFQFSRNVVLFTVGLTL